MHSPLPVFPRAETALHAGATRPAAYDFVRHDSIVLFFHYSTIAAILTTSSQIR